MTADVRRGLIVAFLMGAALITLVTREQGRGVRFQVEFKDAGHLKAGDAIYLLGVDVGEVQDVALVSAPVGLGVRVAARLSDRFAPMVPADSRFVIVSDKFIFGKKALWVVPGASKGPPVTEGQTVVGTEGYTDLVVEKSQARAKEAWTRFKSWMAAEEPDRGPDAAEGPR